MKNALKCFIFFLFACTACDHEKVIDENTLPSRAREYVEAHFPDAAIRQVVRDRDDLSISYEVFLDNQVKLEFTRSGECQSVEGTKTEKLPDTVVPLKVLEYVQAKYPETFITKWEKDSADQEVRLATGVELVFNLSGTFLRIDD